MSFIERIKLFFALLISPNEAYRKEKDNEAKIRAWAKDQDDTRRMVVLFDRHKDALMDKRNKLLWQGEPFGSSAWVYRMGQQDYDEAMRLKVDRLLGLKLEP